MSLKAFYFRFIYRHVMRILHKFDLHYMRRVMPHDKDGGFLHCHWCGISSDLSYSTRLAEGFIHEALSNHEGTAQ